MLAMSTTTPGGGCADHSAYNLAVVAEQQPQVRPMPSYVSLLRWMKSHGLFKRARRGPVHSPGAQAAEHRYQAREVRSYESEYVNGLWHLDFHHGSLRVLLRDGRWVLVYNDLERGRYSLAVSMSDDEGRTWKWTRHLERDASEDPRHRGEYHYPSIVQAADGTLHVTYSYFAPPASIVPDGEGRLPRKSIKHAQFNIAWILER